jgi:hypothetical protein
MITPQPVAYMTIAGIRHAMQPAILPRLVFVADMPRSSSDPRTTPHLGLATLIAWLEPVEPGQRLAWVKRPDGRMLPVRESALCDAANVSARRLGPARPAVSGSRTA